MGSLHATGGNYGAGIGSGALGPSGSNIYISSNAKVNAVSWGQFRPAIDAQSGSGMIINATLDASSSDFHTDVYLKSGTNTLALPVPYTSFALMWTLSPGITVQQL
jgi:hypothetical protein